METLFLVSQIIFDILVIIYIVNEKRGTNNMSEFNQNQYINKYIKEKYDRINLTMKGKKEKIKSAASKRGMSVNEYINCLIDNDLLQNIE